MNPPTVSYDIRRRLAMSRPPGQARPQGQTQSQPQSRTGGPSTATGGLAGMIDPVGLAGPGSLRASTPGRPRPTDGGRIRGELGGGAGFTADPEDERRRTARSSENRATGARLQGGGAGMWMQTGGTRSQASANLDRTRQETGLGSGFAAAGQLARKAQRPPNSDVMSQASRMPEGGWTTASPTASLSGFEMRADPRVGQDSGGGGGGSGGIGTSGRGLSTGTTGRGQTGEVGDDDEGGEDLTPDERFLSKPRAWQDRYEELQRRLANKHPDDITDEELEEYNRMRRDVGYEERGRDFYDQIQRNAEDSNDQAKRERDRDQAERSADDDVFQDILGGFTVEEAAKEFGISPEQVRLLVRNGHLGWDWRQGKFQFDRNPGYDDDEKISWEEFKNTPQYRRMKAQAEGEGFEGRESSDLDDEVERILRELKENMPQLDTRAIEQSIRAQQAEASMRQAQAYQAALASGSRTGVTPGQMQGQGQQLMQQAGVDAANIRAQREAQAEQQNFQAQLMKYQESIKALHLLAQSAQTEEQAARAFQRATALQSQMAQIQTQAREHQYEMSRRNMLGDFLMGTASNVGGGILGAYTGGLL